MKRTYYYLMFLAAIFLFAACSQDEALENVEPPTLPEAVDNSLPYTKVDIDKDVEQILDMPVYIYLPDVPNQGTLYLYDNRDFSTYITKDPYGITARKGIVASTNKTSWYISKYNDPVIGNKYMIMPISKRALITDKTNNTGKRVIVLADDASLAQGYIWNISPSTIDENLYAIYEERAGAGTSPVNMYLRHSAVWYLDTQVGNPYSNGAWAIMPAEEFELLEVTYTLDDDDIFIQLPSIIENITVDNGGDVQQSMTATFSQKATESSTFSRTHGFSVSVASTFKTGIPVLAEGKLNVTTLTNNAWTFGGSEAKEDSRSYSFPLVVPARSKYTARIAISMYDASATYIAKYKGKTSTKIIELRGKWRGVKAGRINYEIINETGNTIRSFSETPRSAIVLE